jgi:23S rRNA pseudouridine1911/1915/1917 synthase
MEEPGIIFEDKQIIVLCKPAGWLSQPDGSPRPDLFRWTREYLKRRWEKPGESYLGLCHRLDRQVSGVVVWGKTSKAAGRLSRQFRERGVEKIYLGLSSGKPPGESGELDYLMTRVGGKTRRVQAGEPGRKAALRWRLLKTARIRDKTASLLEVELLSGLRHQIRAQLADMGLPILGDELYGGWPPPEGTVSIGLFARRLTIEHPVSRERLCFESEPGNLWPWNLLREDFKSP